MRIKTAETTIIEIPFELVGSGVGIMPTAWNSLEFALVRLTDDRGNIGWGEGFGYFTVGATKEILDRLIIPTLVGADIEDIPAWNLATQRRIHMFGRFGVTIFAISAVDMALWDLAAKRADVPLSQLLGGTVRRTVPSYVSLVRYGEDTLVRDACKQARDAGFTSYKLHEIDLDIITAGRETLGDVPICVDVNCGWNQAFIAQNNDRLIELDLDWIEEPIFPPEDFAALNALRGGPAPIGAGENWTTARQCIAALDAEAVDVFQPSVTKVGGVSEYLSAIDAARGRGVRIFPHSPYFGPGFFASLQVAAARKDVAALEYNFVRPDAWLADIDTLRDGPLFTIPDRPGLGFDPDMDIFNRYRKV